MLITDELSSMPQTSLLNEPSLIEKMPGNFLEADLPRRDFLQFGLKTAFSAMTVTAGIVATSKQGLDLNDTLQNLHRHDLLGTDIEAHRAKTEELRKSLSSEAASLAAFAGVSYAVTSLLTDDEAGIRKQKSGWNISGTFLSATGLILKGAGASLLLFSMCRDIMSSPVSGLASDYEKLIFCAGVVTVIFGKVLTIKKHE